MFHTEAGLHKIAAPLAWLSLFVLDQFVWCVANHVFPLGICFTESCSSNVVLSYADSELDGKLYSHWYAHNESDWKKQIYEQLSSYAS